MFGTSSQIIPACSYILAMKHWSSKYLCIDLAVQMDPFWQCGTGWVFNAAFPALNMPPPAHTYTWLWHVAGCLGMGVVLVGEGSDHFICLCFGPFEASPCSSTGGRLGPGGQ